MELVVLRRLVDEMDALLRGTRIDQAYALPRHHLVLVPGRRRDPRLWFAAEPDDPHLYLRPGAHAAPKRPPAFAMALRKYARGRRIAGLSMLADDRVVELRWDRADARLVMELVPRRATAYLLDESSRVVAVWNPRKGRPGVGRLYLPPARRPRAAADELAPSDWRAIESTVLAGDAVRELQRRIEGISATIAREAAARFAGGEPLAVAVAAELDRAATAPSQPVIYAPVPLSRLRAMPAAGELVLSPYPVPASMGEPVTTCRDLVQAAAVFYTERARLRLLDRSRSSLGAAIRSRRTRLTRARGQLVADSPGADSARLRQLGDLLLAHPEAVISGGSARVPDDYSDGALVEIPLDPRLDRVANAQRLYKRARKLERKLAYDAKRLVSIRAELDALESVASELGSMCSASDPMRIGQRFESLGLGVKQETLRDPEAPASDVADADNGTFERPRLESSSTPAAGAGTADSTLEAGVHRVALVDGSEVLIGRSARANDRLTHGIAAPDDWWLHADAPGSHVVLRNPRRLKTPPADALEAAAAIAAWYSKARDSKLVEVRWARAGDVRRPRGGPAGLAVLDRHRSIRVAPRAPEDLASNT